MVVSCEIGKSPSSEGAKRISTKIEYIELRCNKAQPSLLHQVSLIIKPLVKVKGI